MISDDDMAPATEDPADPGEQLANTLYNEPLNKSQDFPDEGTLLTRAERESTMWRKLEAYYVRYLNILREANDDLSSREIETAVRRGKIAEVKDFLALGDPPRVQEPDGPDMGY